jgi:hypothetical protein
MSRLTSTQLVVATATTVDIAINAIKENSPELALVALENLKQKCDDFFQQSDPRRV